MKHKTTTTSANNPGKAAGPAETVPPSTASENEVGNHPSLAEIEELIEFVSKKEFNEFELELGGFRLRWRKGALEPATRERYATRRRKQTGRVRLRDARRAARARSYSRSP